MTTVAEYLEQSRKKISEVDPILATGDDKLAVDYLVREFDKSAWQVYEIDITPHIELMAETPCCGVWCAGDDEEPILGHLSERLTKAAMSWCMWGDWLQFDVDYLMQSKEASAQAKLELQRCAKFGEVLAREILRDFPSIRIWMYRPYTKPYQAEMVRHDGWTFEVQELTEAARKDWPSMCSQ